MVLTQSTPTHSDVRASLFKWLVFCYSARCEKYQLTCDGAERVINFRSGCCWWRRKGFFESRIPEVIYQLGIFFS